MLTALHAGRQPGAPVALDRDGVQLSGATRRPPPPEPAAAYPVYLAYRTDYAIRPARTPYEQGMASMLVRRMDA